MSTGIVRAPRPDPATRATAVVIPAKDEAARIGATVTAAWRIATVDLVIVVDDGSRDDTSRLARQAGADVVRHERNQGKAAAMTTGAAHVAEIESRSCRLTARDLVFADADLQDSAEALGVLIEPVRAGEADMTIATLPPQPTVGGGRGLVVTLAREGIAELTGWTPTQPLSGMRCLSREAYGVAQPLARGWGVETGLTIDILTAGLTVLEVPCPLEHRVTGADWRGQVHRGRQYRDVALALATRRLHTRLRASR